MRISFCLGVNDRLEERDKALRLYKNMGGYIIEVNPVVLRQRCPNTELFFGPYFPVFSPNTGK